MSISPLAIVEEHHELAESAVGRLARYKSRTAARVSRAGGTPEIIRNTITERLLGLPREPLAK